MSVARGRPVIGLLRGILLAVFLLLMVSRASASSEKSRPLFVTEYDDATEDPRVRTDDNPVGDEEDAVRESRWTEDHSGGAQLSEIQGTSRVRRQDSGYVAEFVNSGDRGASSDTYKLTVHVLIPWVTNFSQEESKEYRSLVDNLRYFIENTVNNGTASDVSNTKASLSADGNLDVTFETDIFETEANLEIGYLERTITSALENAPKFSKENFSLRKIKGTPGSSSCTNSPAGFKCLCPFGEDGPLCNENIIIHDPSFIGKACVAVLPIGESSTLSVEFNFMAEESRDATLLHQELRFSSMQYLNLSIIDNHLVLSMVTDLENKTILFGDIQPNEWIGVHLHLNRAQLDLIVNGSRQSKEHEFKQDAVFNFSSPLVIGDCESILEEPSRRFKGCIKELKIMGETLNLSKEKVRSIIAGCNGSICQTNPCGDRGECFNNPTTAVGYECSCNEGYGGPDCQSEDECGFPLHCLNGGFCTLNGTEKVCDCPSVFTGMRCEQVDSNHGGCRSENRTLLNTTWRLYATAAGATHDIPCPENSRSGRGTWRCDSNFQWEKKPDFSKCRTYPQLFAPLNDKTTPLYAADNLTQTASNIEGGNVSSGDIIAIIAELESLRNQHEGTDVEEKENATGLSQKYIKALVDVTNTLLSPSALQQAWPFIPKGKAKRFSTVLQEELVKSVLVEAMFLSFNITKPYSKGHVDVVLVNQPKSYYDKEDNRRYEPGYSQGTQLLLPEKFYDNYTPHKGSDDLILVVFSSSPDLHCITNDVPCMPPRNENGSLENVTATAQANSIMIGATVGYGSSWHADANTFVKLKLRHIYNGSSYNLENPECVWWNTKTDSWSPDGCERQAESNEIYTICHCDHLTNLAAIMDLGGLLKRDTPLWKVLEWMTTIGCSLSIICLAIGIVCFSILKIGKEKTRQSRVRDKLYLIRVHLCTCLMIAEFVLLVGLNATDNRIICAAVAGILQYFFMATFTWNAIEAFNLYVSFIKVFETQASQKHYLIAGYGAPCLLVVLSLASSQGDGYGSDHVCWLVSGSTLWSFAGTIGFILIVNIIAYVKLMHFVWKKRMARGAAGTPKKNKMSSAIAIFLVLGLTWITGFSFMTKGSESWAVLFTLLNSLQGVCILFFGIIFQYDIRKELLEIIAMKLQSLGLRPRKEEIHSAHFNTRDAAGNTLGKTGEENTASFDTENQTSL